MSKDWSCQNIHLPSTEVDWLGPPLARDHTVAKPGALRTEPGPGHERALHKILRKNLLFIHTDGQVTYSIRQNTVDSIHVGCIGRFWHERHPLRSTRRIWVQRVSCHSSVGGLGAQSARCHAAMSRPGRNISELLDLCTGQVRFGNHSCHEDAARGVAGAAQAIFVKIATPLGAGGQCFVVLDAPTHYRPRLSWLEAGNTSRQPASPRVGNPTTSTSGIFTARHPW